MQTENRQLKDSTYISCSINALWTFHPRLSSLEFKTLVIEIFALKYFKIQQFLRQAVLNDISLKTYVFVTATGKLCCLAS